MASTLQTGIMPKPSRGPEWFLKYFAGVNPNEPLTPEKTAELMSCAMKYGGAFILLIVSGITIYVASTDDKALTEGFFKYMVFLIVPIVVASYLVLPIFTQKMNRTTLVLNGVLLIVFLLSLYAFYQTKSPEAVWFMKYAIYGFTILFLIVGLAIIYKVLIRFIYNSRSWGYVIIQLIFYIPCLLLEFIEYIKAELKIAPNTTYILFALEFIIILLYLLVMQLSKYVPKSTTKGLTTEPIYLNKFNQLSDSSILALTSTPNTSSDKTDYRTNYSVSFWAIVTQPSETVMLFLLGEPNAPGTVGKPRVMYEKGQYAFYLTANSTPQFKMMLPIQKWNYFAISYDENKVNIFVNGNLEKTYHFTMDKNDIPKYTGRDTISTGSDIPTKNVGAICNVQYYTVPIGQYEVISEYNLLMYKNPPVR